MGPMAIHPTAWLFGYPECPWRPWFPTADIQLAMFSSLLAINDLWRTFLAQRAWEILGVTVSSFILLHFIFRPARRGLPPVVSYCVPWLGSAITMAKDPDEFFKRAWWVLLILWADLILYSSVIGNNYFAWKLSGMTWYTWHLPLYAEWLYCASSNLNLLSNPFTAHKRNLPRLKSKFLL